jgi:hypothetical protein
MLYWGTSPKAGAGVALAQAVGFFGGRLAGDALSFREGGVHFGLGPVHLRPMLIADQDTTLDLL